MSCKAAEQLFSLGRTQYKFYKFTVIARYEVHDYRLVWAITEM